VSDQRYKDEAGYLWHCEKCDGRFIMSEAGGTFDCSRPDSCKPSGDQVQIYKVEYVGPIASLAGHK
jgi:hypothetical protein